MDPSLERLQKAIASSVSGMTAEDLTRHPEGKWSAAETLEHLYHTYTGTVKGFKRCLQAGKPLASVPTLRQRINIALVVGAGHMPRGRTAPPRTLPRGMAAATVAAEVAAQICAMDTIISQCEERYGRRTRLLDHPVLGPLTAAQWRKFHWVHGRHHVKQIARLRNGSVET